MTRSVVWGGGLFAGAGVLGVVGVLLHFTFRPAHEIKRYADDIAAAADGLRRHLTLGDAPGQFSAATRHVRQAVTGLDQR